MENKSIARRCLHFIFQCKTEFLCTLATIYSVWLHFMSPLDLQWQKYFYINKHWIIDENEPVLKFLLYDGPKVFLIILSIGILVALVLTFFNKITMDRTRKVGLLTFLITVSLFPLTIGLLKDWIRQPCPRELIEFGGVYGGQLWDYFINHGQTRCFPGGHASAPFSLMALYYAFEDPLNRVLYLFVIIPIACFIGFYQVAKGAHFVSDTLFTAASSWVVISIIYSLVKRRINN